MLLFEPHVLVILGGGPPLLAKDLRGPLLLRIFSIPRPALRAALVLCVALAPGADETLPVPSQNLSSPIQEILDARTDGMLGAPQLQVFYSIVETISIAMMHRLIWAERTP